MFTYKYVHIGCGLLPVTVNTRILPINHCCRALGVTPNLQIDISPKNGTILQKDMNELWSYHLNFQATYMHTYQGEGVATFLIL